MVNEISNISLPYQLIIVATGYVIKPIHMILTGYLISALKNVSSKDIKLIRSGLIVFLIGEIACAANYFFTGDTNLLLDMIHDIFMVGLSGIVLAGLFNFFDERIIRLSNPDLKCSIQKICKSCWKSDDVQCRMHNFFYATILGSIIFSLIPFTIALTPVDESFEVFKTILHCTVSVKLLFFKYRIMPSIAISLFIISILLLRKNNDLEKVKLIFFVGMGFMLYSLMTCFFIESFRSVHFISYFWEETTELVAIICIGYFLYLFKDSFSKQ